jgi:peroxiredoxin
MTIPRRRALQLFVASLAAPARAASVWAPAEGRELIGTPAPAWRGLHWLAGGPLDLAHLRGRPIFVRFWTNDCPFCHDSAPALGELWQRYRARGLLVVGIHHPKSPRSHAEIRAAARALGFHFPIATDPEWATVRAYGVGSTFRRFTSVSFLIDRCGLIRFVHDGGTLAQGGPAHATLLTAVEAALAARACE